MLITQPEGQEELIQWLKETNSTEGEAFTLNYEALEIEDEPDYEKGMFSL